MADVMDAHRASKTQMPALIDIELDRRSKTPLHVQISRRLQAQIADGTLADGTRLPPSRDLATRLGTTRNMIVSVYDELVGAGVAQGRGRQGTFVCRPPDAAPRPRAHAAAPLLLQRDPGDADAGQADDGHGAAGPDWRPGQAGTYALPAVVWRDACRKAGHALPPPDYGDPQGDPALRKAISYWLREHRCVEVDAGRIIVTRGTADFLALLATTFIRPGDRCAIEDPGHPLVRHAIAQADAAIDYIPVDADGMMVPEAFGQGHPPLLVHLTPSHQYPMGGRLSAARRRWLAETARRHGTLILENEYGCEFVYEGNEYPTVYSVAPDNTILLGTFANVVSPSLRLGFAVMPERALATTVRAVAQRHLHPSWPAQKIMEHLLSSGNLDRHVRRSRRHYLALRALIKSRLAPVARHVAVSGDGAGLHVVIQGRTPALDAALLAALARRAVRFEPLAHACKPGTSARGLIFGYGHMDREDLQAALDILVDVVGGIVRAGPGADAG
jgi:GntR family transcriptional regulator/MocR family aminotransferase